MDDPVLFPVVFAVYTTFLVLYNKVRIFGCVYCKYIMYVYIHNDKLNGEINHFIRIISNLQIMENLDY